MTALLPWRIIPREAAGGLMRSPRVHFWSSSRTTLGTICLLAFGEE
jgi:hypothetical protein